MDATSAILTPLSDDLQTTFQQNDVYSQTYGRIQWTTGYNNWENELLDNITRQWRAWRDTTIAQVRILNAQGRNGIVDRQLITEDLDATMAPGGALSDGVFDLDVLRRS